MNKIKKEIGRAVSAARKNKGYSTYHMQKFAHIQPTQLLAIESGNSNYTIDSLLRVCAVLDVKVSVNAAMLQK